MRFRKPPNYAFVFPDERRWLVIDKPHALRAKLKMAQLDAIREHEGIELTPEEHAIRQQILDRADAIISGEEEEPLEKMLRERKKE